MVRLVTDAAPQVVHADWWPERMTVTLKGAASYYERLCIKGAAMVAHQDSATGALTGGRDARLRTGPRPDAGAGYGGADQEAGGQ